MKYQEQQNTPPRCFPIIFLSGKYHQPGMVNSPGERHGPLATVDAQRVLKPTPRYPPLEPFDYVERGKGADATFPDLLGPGSKMDDMTGVFGAEIHGVQLSQLCDKGKDQLALLAAMKKVLGTIVDARLLQKNTKTYI